MLCEEKPAIKGLSHLQYEERNCAVPGWSHLQYKEKVVQCKEKVCSIRNVTSAVQVEKMLRTRIVRSAVQKEGCEV